ncbi:hypothetical protein TNCT_140011 [Trichonephila clavata]|uniref:Uncharacterized protein n=1 Tax=Trichonephila clavata TaxID=2740835 RepID=A0A8X6LM62_TRICU|nr:hypothetical protein TNCT_140011 [Trichonephila clavata]
MGDTRPVRLWWLVRASCRHGVVRHAVQTTSGAGPGRQIHAAGAYMLHNVVTSWLDQRSSDRINVGRSHSATTTPAREDVRPQKLWLAALDLCGTKLNPQTNTDQSYCRDLRIHGFYLSWSTQEL